jgi:hypothetical protein
VDNIKMDGIDCIGLAQDSYNWSALINAIMKLQVPNTGSS